MAFINRRKFLSTASLTPIALSYLPQAALAQANNLDLFMSVSQKLTTKADLSRETGQRFLAAFQDLEPEVVEALSDLDQALKEAKSLDAAMVANSILPPPLQASALQIMRAWYTGEVKDRVVAFETALMFQAMGTDIVYIRSYCPAEPAYWTRKPVISG